MILMVLKDQAKAVDECENASDKWVTGGSLYESMRSHENEIKQLDFRAEKVYMAVSAPILLRCEN